MNKRIVFKQVFGFSTLLVAITYLYSIWFSNSTVIKQYIISIPIEVVVVTIILSALAGLCNSLLWFNINLKLDRTANFSKSLLAWSIGRLYRYIPGKVAGYYVRHKLQNSSTKVGLVASINEFILPLIPVLLLVIIYLINSNFPIPITIVFSFLLLLTFFIRPISSFISKKWDSTIEFDKLLFSPTEIISKFKFIVPAMMLHGLSFLFIVKVGLDEKSFNFAQALITLYISGIIGQLALIAPGGIGVREAAIVFVLSTFGINENIAITIAAISRVVLLISEVLNVLLAYLYFKMAYK